MPSDTSDHRNLRVMPPAPVLPLPLSRQTDEDACRPLQNPLDLGDLFQPVSQSSSRVRIRTNTTPHTETGLFPPQTATEDLGGLGCLSERRRCGTTVFPMKVPHVWFQPSDSARGPSPTRQQYSGSYPGPTEPQSSDSRGSRGSQRQYLLFGQVETSVLLFLADTRIN
ncbi:hypothetical protein B0T20DRAFT_2668 [Sordaria brevicollis]|uniref:Uncharacterized protein n=1 Tax=Sordaria brevicollis TaxID=83679 RepID=A0AAE0UG49_SORBR|nr:hypothetical protein B0T20DRAFT_2668 [Sordaria brevicollis]